ncbi:MAG: response regulator transcription factor RpaB [Candidatus Sericytochromatia bacterium]
MKKGKILVVDDEASIRQIVEARLNMAGFEVVTAGDGEEALEVYRAERPDLIVLDIMMPRVDGLQVCREIRKQDSIPIIMLTAKGEIPDRINALEMGADDYVTKPFSPRELEARIKAVLRRTMIAPAKPAAIEVEDIFIDLIKRQVYKSGEKVKLTEMEFSLLELLALHPGKAFTRIEILQQVWGYRSNQYSDTRVVDVHVSRLRSKLEKDVAEPELILTARGTGYMFQNYNLGSAADAS